MFSCSELDCATQFNGGCFINETNETVDCFNSNLSCINCNSEYSVPLMDDVWYFENIISNEVVATIESTALIVENIETVFQFNIDEETSIITFDLYDFNSLLDGYDTKSDAFLETRYF